MSKFGETVFFIILGAAILLKVIDLVWDIVIAVKRKRRGKKSGVLGWIFGFSDNSVRNYITEEQNRIFTEDSIRAHEQAVTDHLAGVQSHNDMFNNMF